MTEAQLFDPNYMPAPATFQYADSRGPVLGVHVAELLLDVIEDPSSPQHKKDIARETILEYIREK